MISTGLIRVYHSAGGGDAVLFSWRDCDLAKRTYAVTKLFELLVFDWDGTLMDSTGNIVACAQRAAGDIGLEPPPAQAIRETIGLSLSDSMQRLYPEGPPEDTPRLVERYRHHWIHDFRAKLVLYPNVRETLETLRDAGYLLAVATGKSRTGLDFDLQACQLGPFFQASRTADETSSKPSPQMLFEIFEELGARPKESLMIGDTTFDLDMAANAGCASLGLLSGSHQEVDLRSSAPLDLLERVSQLPDWLESRAREANRG